jgi:hypothetical protein
MIKSFFIILTVSLLLSCNPQSIKDERFYIDEIHYYLGGDREVTVPSGRVDLVTSEYAYEVEWAWNWKEAVGQSLWYGLQAEKKPGIILIMRESNEFRYVQQLESALRYANLSDAIQVLVYPNDFERSRFR